MGRNGFSQDDFTYLVATKTTSRPLTAAERRAPKRKLGLKKRKKELSPYDRSVDITQLLFDNPPLIGKPLLKKKRKKGLRKKVSLQEYMLDLPAVATPQRENKTFGPESLELTRGRKRLEALGFGKPLKKGQKVTRTSTVYNKGRKFAPEPPNLHTVPLYTVHHQPRTFRALTKATMSPASQERASLATRRELRRLKTVPTESPLMEKRHQMRLARALRRERITIQGGVVRKLVDGKGQLVVRAIAAEAPMVELLVDSLKLRTPVVIEIVDE